MPFLLGCNLQRTNAVLSDGCVAWINAIHLSVAKSRIGHAQTAWLLCWFHAVLQTYFETVVRSLVSTDARGIGKHCGFLLKRLRKQAETRQQVRHGLQAICSYVDGCKIANRITETEHGLLKKWLNGVEGKQHSIFRQYSDATGTLQICSTSWSEGEHSHMKAGKLTLPGVSKTDSLLQSAEKVRKKLCTKQLRLEHRQQQARALRVLPGSIVHVPVSITKWYTPYACKLLGDEVQNWQEYRWEGTETQDCANKVWEYNGTRPHVPVHVFLRVGWTFKLAASCGCGKYHHLRMLCLVHAGGVSSP